MPVVQPKSLAMEVIKFACPLPPKELRANGRAHHMVKGRLADQYSIEVSAASFGLLVYERPWKAAHVTYTWHYCGVAPDHGNLGGNTKYLQDILCMAPKSKAGKHRWYLGLIEDDKGITATYRMVNVKHKHEERVEIELVRM